MSKLIFCPIKTAKQPYHLKSIDLRFFSLEELLYFYKKHEILIDKSIMQPEFIYWVKESLRQDTLAEKLHQILVGGGSLAMFVEVLISCVNTFEEEEKEHLLKYISQMEEKNEFERRKILADQMLEREKFESAILEYRRILDSNEFYKGQEELYAKVWHNLGYCYSNLLLYEQAIECFKNAYSFYPFEETQDAVLSLRKVVERFESVEPIAEESYLNLLERTDDEKRKQRYEQLQSRMQEYLRSTM